MTAAFSFGPLGAMTDLVVAPAVAVENGRELKTTTTSRGVRWAQRARRNPRTWTVSRPWRDPAWARMLTLAAHGVGGDMWLYDLACARQNMLPASATVGTGATVNVITNPPVRRNLLPNPSFESGVNQAGLFNGGHGGSATSATSTDWEASGTVSLKITPNGTATSAARYFGPTSGVASAFPLAAGKTYTIAGTIHIPSGYVSNTVGDRAIYVGTVSSSGTINYTFASSQVAPATPGDYRLVVTVAIPSDAKGGFFRLCIGSTVTTTYWDAITVEEGVTDGSFFSGDTPNTDAFSYVWEGVANASPSRMVEGSAVTTPLGSVTWTTQQVGVVPGREYTLSGWAGSGTTTLTGTWRDAAGTSLGTVTLTGATGRASTTAAAPTGAATLSLARVGVWTAIRLHEGADDGDFYLTEGTPAKVAVQDPQRTYQMITDNATATDYEVTIMEVG